MICLMNKFHKEGKFSWTAQIKKTENLIYFSAWECYNE
ncbi:hypothetical protein SanJ4206_0239 [Streptococcus anginosus]|uniref:Uncharacterized protein n=1 Tax=Streptococcus anginosus SK1138 TaxID=1161422 RepID=A0AAD2T9N9_STRAP|nr:hypothetical protein SanJ4206_0239 [Streptococcus anginosus]EJP27604.1 hypothetical protein HMPREF1126_0387 [Streptococcus anginosus SK1138]ETS96027.1 hypothetical protein HMPREF1512_0475 [Streptococcus sp. OBRC6]EUB11969.1 hypothetical protein HMPREF1510_0095 [Streptococcus sp. ACC21]EUC76650.1 hypothetical protein HMPREF1511_1826 [Streptococcus sp. CM7]EWC97005.1 hypothetical protein HMPREF1509_0193 [Streptococcus sp. AC15]